MNQEFEVEVVRIAYGFKTIKVTAQSPEEAKRKALEQAGNYEFSEKTSEYQAESVNPL